MIPTEDIHPEDRVISSQPGAVFRMRNSAGHYHWVTAAKDGGVADIDLLVREREAAIGQMLAAQEQTNAYRQLYRAVLTNSLDGFLLGEVRLDDEGSPVDVRVLAVNEAFHSQTGEAAEAIRGQRLSDIGVRPDATWEQLWQDVMLGGKTVRTLLDTGQRWLELVLFRVERLVFGAHIRDISAERAAEQALALSEARFRLIAENSADLVLQVDYEGKIRWVSPSCERLLGHRPEAMVGRPSAEFVHPDDREEVGLAQQAAQPCDIRLLRADGSSRWMHFDVHEGIDPTDGSPVRIGSAHDIDVERRMRDQVRRGESRMSATVAALMDPYIVLQAFRDENGELVDFVYTEVNEPAAQYLGLTRAELIGQRYPSMFPSMRDSQFPLYKATVETGVPLSLDDAVLDLGEEDVVSGQRIYDVRAMKYEDGLSLTWREVTDRSRAARALRNSEEESRLAMDTSPLGVALLHMDGRIHRVNPALSSLLGRETEWLVGRNVTGLFGPGEVDRFREMVAGLSPGMTSTSNQTLISGYGAMVPVQVTVASIPAQGSEPLLVCHVVALTSALRGPLLAEAEYEQRQQNQATTQPAARRQRLG